MADDAADAAAPGGGPATEPATEALAAFAAVAREAVARVSDRAADLLHAALVAADPHPATLGALAEHGGGKGRVPVAVGKAAVPMARAWQAWGGPPGLLVAPPGAKAPSLAGWELRAGEHPVPGALSYAAGKRVLDWAREGLPLVLLLSGGASAMVEAPVPGPDLHRPLMERLQRSGAPIEAVNAARSLLSGIKAGGLASECVRAGGSLTVLYVSDVPGDDPAVVGSGPGAWIAPEVLRERLDGLPGGLRDEVLELAGGRDVDETGPDDVVHRCVLPRRAPAEAAAARARSAGLAPELVRLDGPVDEVADRVAGRMRMLRPDEVLILWGEPTVAVPAAASASAEAGTAAGTGAGTGAGPGGGRGGHGGRGGRATHLVGALMARSGELGGDADETLGEGSGAAFGGRAVAVAVAATDGVDGPSGTGGGYARLPADAARSQAARDALSAFDAAAFLEGLPLDEGGVVPAAPTGANSADVGVVVGS